jgi:hypothetical protein
MDITRSIVTVRHRFGYHSDCITSIMALIFGRLTTKIYELALLSPEWKQKLKHCDGV